MYLQALGIGKYAKLLEQFLDLHHFSAVSLAQLEGAV